MKKKDKMRLNLLAGIIFGLSFYFSVPFSYAYNDKGYFSERERVINRTLCQLDLNQSRVSSTDSEYILEVPKSLPKHTWELGAEISHITYKEPGLMKDEGTMRGIICSYTYQGWAPPASRELDKWRLTLEVRYSSGDVDYEGALQDGTPYEIDNIDDYVWEVRGLIGYDFPKFKTSTIIPYFGFGYRYLNDNPSDDPAGYLRESNYYYSPVGVRFVTALGTGWSIGATLEYDILWSGKQKTYLSDFDEGFNDPVNDQQRGYGCRASLELQKKCKLLDFAIEPFIRYWKIRDSDIVAITYDGDPTGYGAMEPKNNSTEYGIKVGVRF
jgi:hypothetical protein